MAGPLTRKNLRAGYYCAAFFLFLAAFMVRDAKAGVPADELSWPAVSENSKPWAYWWWMGSAVEKEEIAKNLKLYSDAGLGGLLVTPIYGAKGFEGKYINYLSPQWMEMLAFTSEQARKLGMGIDMSTGTGWPFGGPQVDPSHAARNLKIKGRGANLRAEVRGTGQKVKRAAPGGEGLVMDYFSEDALQVYLARFNRAFSGMKPGLARAQYNDSFEAYGADWTNGMFDQFKERRGYDLRDHLAALQGRGGPDYVSRVMSDYRETVSELLLDQFTIPWTNWAHGLGFITRNEAHGSPGNLLDLYAAADIPETETFGSSRFNIPGLHYYKLLPENAGKPDPLVMKFASSAANVTGKKLVSSESCTWLGEHFTVTLAQVKPEIDRLWSAGVNHVFFHGIAYSPTYESWPGWLFYAETNFGPSNTFWKDLPALNAYISLTQAFLQEDKPANDILLYWPVHDLWSNVYGGAPWPWFAKRSGRAFKKLLAADARGFLDEMTNAAGELVESNKTKVKLFTVHNADNWLHGTPFGETAKQLMSKGYTFDYVSDRMVAALVYDGSLHLRRGASYRIIVVPRCRYMPFITFEKLVELAQGGATVIFVSGFPEDEPGYLALAEKSGRMSEQIKSLGPGESAGQGMKTFLAGKGRVLVGDDLQAMLSLAGIKREQMADSGLSFVRKAHEQGHDYFIANLGPKKIDGWIELAASAESAVIFDTLNEKAGVAATKTDSRGETLVYLQLDPGRSIILRAFTGRKVKGAVWEYLAPAGEAVAVTGKWKVEFLQGGPRLPPDFESDQPGPWTEKSGEDCQYFSGTARYSIEFELPGSCGAPDEWMLELGDVRESARVLINDKQAGVAFSAPFSLRVGRWLKPGKNLISIEVTNLGANRIIYMDRHRQNWKKFRDINYVNVMGMPFNAASWDIFESGLKGRVKLAPFKIKQVEQLE